MAHLWHLQSDPSCWQPQPVKGTFDLAHGVRLREAGPSAVPLADAWLLLSSPGASVSVNGEPLYLGARVLRDKDEIHVAGQRWFYSTEKLAHIATYHASESGSAFCARCKKPMEDMQPAVQCPACGAWHHQSEAMPCWLYSAKCALCSQPTSLESGYQWTPETEEVWS